MLIPDAPATGPAGSFEEAWRAYLRRVFIRGSFYTISSNTKVLVYVAENKVLAGQEARNTQGEATGRKLVVVFYEFNDDNSMIQRVHRDTQGQLQQLLTMAELLQTIGGTDAIDDTSMTAAGKEVSLERLYETLEIVRYHGTVEPNAPDLHMYRLDNEVDAEEALLLSLPDEQRTKMVLARILQRHGLLQLGETLHSSWKISTLADLRTLAAPAHPAPVRKRPAAGST